MLVIKTNLEGDLRRFTLHPNEVNFANLQQILAKLYSIHISQFKISYLDDQGDSVTLSNDGELNHAIQQVNRFHQPALRLFLQMPSTIANNAEITEHGSFSGLSQENMVLDKIFSSPEFHQRVEHLVVETVTSKVFVDNIVNSLVPKLISVLKETATVSVAPHTVQPQQTIESQETVRNEEIAQIVGEAESTPDAPTSHIEEKKPAESQTQEQPEKNKTENQDVPNKEDEPEAFVMVKDNTEEVQPVDQPNPLVRSIMSIFKGLKKDSLRQEAEDTSPVPEELLKQLAEMGFLDRETNMKTFRFHKKFNEGLDEVVEDLLIQSSLGPEGNKTEPSDQ